MSRGNKQRRDARRKVERREPAANSTRGPSLGRVVRKACSRCGGLVAWVDAQAAGSHGLEVNAAALFIGEAVEDLEFWVCAFCGEAGAIGPASLG